MGPYVPARQSTPCARQGAILAPVEPAGPSGYVYAIMISTVAIMVALSATSGQTPPAGTGSGFFSASTDSDRRAFTGLRTGTLGIGLEGGYRINDYFQVRGHGAGLVYSDDQTVADISSDLSLRLASIGGGVDIFPFRRVFYVTAGVRYNFNRAVFNAQPANDYQIGNNIYTAAEIGQLSGEAQFAPHAWFAGIGLAARPWDGPVEIAFEAGVYQQGVPTIDYNVTGLLSDDPALLADLDREAQRARQDLEKYSAFPLIALNLRYRF